MTLWRERLSNVSSKENLQVGNPLNYKRDRQRGQWTTRVYSAMWFVIRARAGNCIVEKASLTNRTVFLFHPRFSLLPVSLCRSPGPSYFHLAATALLQSTKLANVASQDEMELQERISIKNESLSLSLRKRRCRRKEGERYEGKFDCDIKSFLFCSNHWQIRR